MKEIKLSEIASGNIFKIGDIEFIKFSEENGEAVAVTKDIVFFSEYGKNNNFAESKVMERLEKEFLPKVTEIIGAENILEHETDLISLDGLKTYGITTGRISIPTFDFYRANVEIFDNYKVDSWWWLATPDTTPEHINDKWCRCVSPVGAMNDDDYRNFNGGVRPFLKFVSSIFVSSEEDKRDTLGGE